MEDFPEEVALELMRSNEEEQGPCVELWRGREITVCTQNNKHFGLMLFPGTFLPRPPPSNLQGPMITEQTGSMEAKELSLYFV